MLDLDTHNLRSVEPEMATWIEETVGGRLTGAWPLAAANRRQAWTVEINSAHGGEERFFFQYSPNDVDGGQDNGDPYTIGREAELYRALQDRIPIARVVSVHPTGRAMLTEWIPGATAVTEQSYEDQLAILKSMMRALARLHALPPNSIGVDRQRHAHATDMHSAVIEEIRAWEEMYRSTGQLDPMIEFGLKWLRENIPAVDLEPRIVHGDPGPGNLIFRAKRVVALIDWEFWHLGDPVEDLAWLSMRWARFLLEPSFEDLLKEYVAAGGAAVDHDRLRYYRVLVEWRIVIIRHRGTSEPVRTGDIAKALRSRALNRRLFLEALADASGIDSTLPPVWEGPDTRRSETYDALLRLVEDGISPLVEDDVACHRLSNLGFALRYLRSADRMASRFEAEDLAALERVVPAPVDDVDSAQHVLGAAIRDGHVDDGQVIEYLRGQVARDTAVMRYALGDLATSHLPPLGPR